jgi:polyisoprenoid-binding protein YceI
MAKWFFEPGHTAAEFSVRHMMVTFVRGHFKDIHGTLVFDPADPSDFRRGHDRSFWNLDR